MSENNATYGSDFALVFRHELAAIQDRRRSQRMEALSRLSIRGDYSRRAVHWAVEAAKQEAALADRAAEVAEQAAKLTSIASQARQMIGDADQSGKAAARAKVVEQIRKWVQYVRDREKRWINHPTQDAGTDAAAFRADDATWVHLRECFRKAAKELDGMAQGLDNHADDRSTQAAAAAAKDAAEQFLRCAPPIRALPRTDDETAEAKGNPEIVEQNAQASRDAANKAKDASKSASDMSRRIIKAAAINTAAGKVAPARGMVELLALAAEAPPDTVKDEALAAAEAAEAALKDTIKCLDGIVPDELPPLSKELSQFINDFQSRQAVSLSEMLPALKILLKRADETCGRVSIDAYAELPTQQSAEAKQNCIRTLHELLIVSAQKAEQKDTEQQIITKGYAEAAKEIVKVALEELGKKAIEAAGWAWRAEQHAADALREAHKVLRQLQEPVEKSSKQSKKGVNAEAAAVEVSLPEGPDLVHVRAQALEQELVGLAFCGGGIRSATFGLGVLQALGQLKLLHFFDYLSTVSGGGYIGSWLAAWVHRECSLTNVEKQLDPSRVTQADAKRVVKTKEDETDSSSHPLPPEALDEEPEPIHHLRAYSRYLTPRPGIFSADTWTFFAIYVRNLLINLAILLPSTLAVVLLSRLLIWVFTLQYDFLYGLGNWEAAILFLAITTWLVCWLYNQRNKVYEAAESPTAQAEGADRVSKLEGHFLLGAVLLMAVSGLWLFSHSPPLDGTMGVLRGNKADILFLRYPLYNDLKQRPRLAEWTTNGLQFTLVCAVATGVLSLLAGSLLRISLLSRWRRPWRTLFSDLILGAGLGLSLSLVLHLIVWPLGSDAAAIVALGVPASLLALILADYVDMLLVGKWMEELEREWRSRLGAVLFMLAAGWLLFFGATLYLPWGLEQIADPKKRTVVFSTVAATWGGLSTLGGWAGRWLQAGTASRRSLPWLRLLVLLGPPVFLIGLLAAVAMLVPLLPSLSEGKLIFPATDDSLDAAREATASAGQKWLVYFCISIILFLLFRHTVDVNRNSMHMFYANRLIRCYLGASRRKRSWCQRVLGPTRVKSEERWLWGSGAGGAPTNADVHSCRIARREPTFTDFDPADDLLLQHLQAVGPDTQRAGEAARPAQANNGYRGPYPLLNTTLNLVAGSDLAHQDRKADSFVLTPDYCGSKLTGYARLLSLDREKSSVKDHLTLGRAMTISGAAVDPNMGVGQSPPLTALMTVLNTRLGWWLQNPAKWKKWTGAGPKAGSMVIEELFGQTDSKSWYIHLSDGGHFENLGVYELIRRRCRFIVVTDATPDRHAASDNLGSLLRLIRTDFGIRIDLDTAALDEAANASTRWHCAIGLIHYEDVDPQSVSGVLVYLRACLTGDESPDVRQYADSCPAFPHQSTLDQFFSEAQLESYRALGYHVAHEVFAPSAEAMNRDGCDPTSVQSAVRQLFADVRRRWFPKPPEADGNFTRAAQLYLEADHKLRTEDRLQKLRRELYPELRAAPAKMVLAPSFAPPRWFSMLPSPPAEGDPSADMLMVAEMLQVMELVWLGMKLDDYHAHPLNSGWMNLFRRWTNSPTFHGCWPILRGEFSQDFTSFCERALNMVPTSIRSDRLSKTDLAALLPDVREMDQEFLNEWISEKDRLSWLPTGRYLRDAVATAAPFANQVGLDRPLVWRLSFKYGQKGTESRTCGLVCLGPSFRGSVTELELLVWIRGPYRNLGGGRRCLKPILGAIRAALLHKPPRTERPFRLYVYYPDAGVNRAERLEQLMWRNFFFDYGFRSVDVDDPGLFPGVIALAQEVS